MGEESATCLQKGIEHVNLCLQSCPTHVEPTHPYRLRHMSVDGQFVVSIQSYPNAPVADTVF